MVQSVGLGLHTTDVAMEPSAVLSTAPASPSEEMPNHKPDLLPRSNNDNNNSTTSITTTHSDPPQHSTAAQFSFGPATQQTVTTVTTTTTVSFPPLVIKPPRDLLERDIRQYPLAYSPTPEHLKKFCTDFQGRPIRFHEEEDAQDTVRRHKELQTRLQRHKGTIRTDETKSEYRTPRRAAPLYNRHVHNVRASQAPKRATPPSIAEAAELASLQRKTKRLRSHLHLADTNTSDHPSLNLAADLDDPSPATPDTDAGGSSSMPPPKNNSGRSVLRRQKTSTSSRLRDSWDEKDYQDADMADNEYQEEESQPGPPLYRDQEAETNAFGRDIAMSDACTRHAAATATPPTVEADVDAEEEPEPRRRPALPNILTSSQQDASLPSPSLSPITAAANLASRRNAFDASFGEHLAEDDGTLSGLDLDDDTSMERPTYPVSQTTSTVPSKTTSVTLPSTDTSQTTPPQNGPTMMDIPTMVEAFDAMPEAMQTYLIYQFLRRSAKPTLQMVANVVNPALKCDPFNVLPVEVGLNITRFLDFQSMCRAAQVSKRWRRMINSDEKAWKDLLDRDEFKLPDGEIARAVREGWGWQHSGEEGYEQDLSIRESPEPENGAASIVASDEEETGSSTMPPRQKRKASSRYSSSGKKLKRRSMTSSSSNRVSSSTAVVSSSRLNRLAESAKGPHCLATAATQIVPHPSVGLPSLKNMHLFKSLYQRHFLVRKAWGMADSKPQHIAFRAHHRHVVTCLLFDSDKILTGSDDTKINVYDTKTGALRGRLEGHEGGVWALQYDGNTLVSGSTDRSVRVWDIKSGRCLQVFQGHTSTVRCLVILKPEQIGTNPDGTPLMMPKEPLIITGSRDSTLRVWKLPQPGSPPIYQAGPPANDRDNPYYLRTLSGHHNSVRAIAAHGDTLVSGSYDCTVRVWRISTGDLVHRLQGHTQKVYSVVLDTARNRCISGSMDNFVKIWDLTTGACLFNLEGHTSLVGLLDLSHDRLVSAAADSTLRVWDPESGKAIFQLSAHTGAITCFQHDGQKVISGSDRTLKMWDVKTGTLIRDLLTDLSGVWQVRFDQRRCVAAVQRNALTYIEVLDFGASRDGVPEDRRGRRIVVNQSGKEIEDVDSAPSAPGAAAAAAAAVAANVDDA